MLLRTRNVTQLRCKQNIIFGRFIARRPPTSILVPFFFFKHVNTNVWPQAYIISRGDGLRGLGQFTNDPPPETLVHSPKIWTPTSTIFKMKGDYY